LKIGDTIRSSEWKYLTFSALTLLFAIFSTFIEWLWVHGWSSSKAMCIPPAVSTLGTLGLFVGPYSISFFPRQALRISLVSSVLVIACVALFLVEIQSIAAGNNDSGEVFPLVFLPAIWVLVFALITLRKLRQLRTPEVTQWQQ